MLTLNRMRGRVAKGPKETEDGGFNVLTVPTMKNVLLLAAVSFALPCMVSALPGEKPLPDPNKPVSYFKDVRPIFQAQCQGCHQPAKAKGGYVMTDFARMLAGGESAEKGELAVVPGNPDKSLL